MIIRILIFISRIFIGIVFMFSGFIKAVDPWGSAYKFKEYFEALGMEAFIPYALTFSIILIGVEFIVGFCLFFGLKFRLATWGALLFMLLFLPLTLWLAISNKVSDCGCFGDAIKLTNWQTFYKNVIIIVPTIILFIFQKRAKPYCSCIKQWLLSGIGVGIVAFVIWYSYSHLPLIDFLPYKVGNNISEMMKIPDGMPKDEYEQFITLKDTTKNKTIEIPVSTYSGDSIYWGTGTKYKYISISDAKLVKEGYKTPIHDLTINTASGENILDSVLAIDNYTFIIISTKLEKSDVSKTKEINELARWASSKNLLFIGLTSSLKEDINKYITNTQASFMIYNCDEITLETIIRANPGIVLLKKGTIIAKWHYNDIPTPKEFEKEYLTK